jgi:hypothetical protein
MHPSKGLIRRNSALSVIFRASIRVNSEAEINWPQTSDKDLK